MTKPLSHEMPARAVADRSGKQHWLRITGLSGWKRAQLGLPAFGDANCHPRPGSQGVPPNKPESTAG